MQDVTTHFDVTPFNNTVFKFMSTDNMSESRFIGYRPATITSWNCGYYDHFSKENMSYIVHEMSHVIDMYQRDKSRLLLDNFGYKMDGTINTAGAKVECNVIAIQRTIENAHPDFFHKDPLENFYDSLNSSRNMTMDESKFYNLINNTMKGLSVNELYDTWDAACEFLKEHI